MDGIGIPQVGLGSGWAGLLIVVILVLNGRLYSRRAMEDIIHDRDEWRAESRIKDAQIHEKDEQLRHMGEVGRTVDHIMRSLPRPNDEVAP